MPTYPRVSAQADTIDGTGTFAPYGGVQLPGAGTDTTITQASGLTTIAGLSVTIVSGGVSQAWDVTGLIDVTSNLANVGWIVTVAPYVDGVALSSITGDAGQILWSVPVAGARVPSAQYWYVTGLSAGSHTLDLRATPVAWKPPSDASASWQINSVHTRIHVSRVK